MPDDCYGAIGSNQVDAAQQASNECGHLSLQAFIYPQQYFCSSDVCVLMIVDPEEVYGGNSTIELS